MLKEVKADSPRVNPSRLRQHLAMLERMARDDGMDLVAHLLGCARMAVEQDLPLPGDLH